MKRLRCQAARVICAAAVLLCGLWVQALPCLCPPGENAQPAADACCPAPEPADCAASCDDCQFAPAAVAPRVSGEASPDGFAVAVLPAAPAPWPATRTFVTSRCGAPPGVQVRAALASTILLI